MAVTCGFSYGICTIRITRVDSRGSVIAGLNSYVSDKPVTVTVSPNIETGNTVSLRNGCGCSLVRFKAPDIFNWFEFEFTDGSLEPIVQEFMLGADGIVDGSDTVGVNYPGALACDDDEPAVGFEFWTQNVNGSAQDSTFPWFHFVFPRTVWHLGNNEFSEDITRPVLSGFSKTNTLWGNGPYNDGPPDGTNIEEGGWWMTDQDPPTAECAAQSVTATS